MDGEKLLHSIVEQLRDMDKANEKWNRDNIGSQHKRELRVDYIDAVFMEDGEEIGEIGVIHAMDCCVNDVVYFGDFCIEDADSVTLR